MPPRAKPRWTRSARPWEPSLRLDANKSNPDTHRLCHARQLLWIGIIVVAIFFGAAAVSNLYPNPTITVRTMSGFILFGALGGYLVLLYFRNWHSVSPEGLNFAGLFFGRGAMAWKEVTSLRYHGGGWHWFVLKAGSGQTAYVSAMMQGLPAFARLAMAHVPRQSIEPQTLKILEIIAV